MYCPSCNSKIHDNSKRCPFCTAEIVEVSSTGLFGRIGGAIQAPLKLLALNIIASLIVEYNWGFGKVTFFTILVLSVIGGWSLGYTSKQGR